MKCLPLSTTHIHIVNGNSTISLPTKNTKNMDKHRQRTLAQRKHT